MAINQHPVFTPEISWRIYKIDNVVTGKSYIGLTKRSIEVRLNAHITRATADSKCETKSYLWRSIRKYGKEVFKITTIHEGILTAKEAAALEKYYIHIYNTYTYGYNSTIGGEGVSGYKMPVSAIIKQKKAYRANLDSFREKLSVIAVSSNRKRYNSKKHWFYHPNYGTDYGYAVDIARKYQLPIPSAVRLANGKQHTSLGWCIIKT
jgi:hypothetical protein